MYFYYPILLKALRLTFSRRYFSVRHACFVSIFTVLFLLLRGFVWIVRLVDQVFFRGYRKQTIKNPIYIVGNPRSGTTFMHRLISHDRQFSYIRLYHTIFPAVTFYRAFAGLGRLDRIFGSPLTRLLNIISHKGFKGWDKIHKTGPKEAESDEMLFVYAMLSPLLGLLFPFLGKLEEAAFADRIPAEERRRLMAYYKDCLQRHMYATGPNKILLEKVALIAGRLGSILEAFPDIRIVHLIRHPYQCIPSLVSMFYVPWTTLAPQVKPDSKECRDIAKMTFEYYRYILKLKKALPKDQFIDVYYEDLVADPEATVERIYHKFNLEMSAEYRTVLKEETEKARQYKSKHSYSLEEYGLTKEMVYEELKDVFEEYGFDRYQA